MRRGDSIAHAADALVRAEAVAFPTDTVLGLGVSVEAAKRPDLLYEIKLRDEGKPIAWLVGGLDDLDRYGRDIPEYARKLAEAFWPGSLTLVVVASDAVPPAFRSAAGTIAMRMPDCAQALELIRAAASPLATSSANIAGEPAPNHTDDLDERIARAVGYVLVEPAMPDAPRVAGSGTASTVVDCVSENPVILREGSVTAAAIQEVLS